MRRARPVTAAALLLLWHVATGMAGAAQDRFDQAEAEAKANEATAEGKQFARAVGEAFGREHGPTVSRCAREVKRPDLSNFDLLLRIDANGVVNETLVKPATNLAVCVQNSVKGWERGEPPHPDFWVKVGVTLKRR